MKVGELHPEYLGMDCSEFIDKVSMNYVHPVVGAVTEYYDSALSIPDIYAHYGAPLRTLSGDEFQVPCILFEHGGSDVHNSSRFYTRDRESGKDSQRLWCFKCQKFTTPFWLVYKREVDFNGASFREVLKNIWVWFRIPFPLSIVLEFDPSQHYQMEDRNKEEKLRIFGVAQRLRQQKIEDPGEYLRMLKNFWKSEYK
jgi:hypothetical protein